MSGVERLGLTHRIAAAIHGVDAPRVANGHEAFEDLSEAEQRRFLTYAGLAIAMYEEAVPDSKPSA